jgi:hypothetical protein
MTPIAVPERIAIEVAIAEISNCFEVMQELRTHLTLDLFLDRVQRQQQMNITSHHFSLNL